MDSHDKHIANSIEILRGTGNQPSLTHDGVLRVAMILADEVERLREEKSNTKAVEDEWTKAGDSEFVMRGPIWDELKSTNADVEEVNCRIDSLSQALDKRIGRIEKEYTTRTEMNNDAKELTIRFEAVRTCIRILDREAREARKKSVAQCPPSPTDD